MSAGLRRTDIAEVRFHLAFVRTQLGRYKEALGVLSDLKGEPKRRKEIVYLELYLHSRLEEYVEMEQIFEQRGSVLDGYLDTALMMGIALLHLGRQNWKRRDIEQAVRYFERVRSLGVLLDEVPANVGDHQILLGVLVLFDKDVVGARAHFDGAKTSAEANTVTSLQAELGLLLCDWISEEMPDIDGGLLQAVGMMEQQFGFPRDSQHEGEAADTAEHLAGENLERLYVALLLWHAVSLIYTWFRLPAKTRLPETELRQLDERVEKVKQADPELGDPYLIQGLIRYYFATDNDSKWRAVECLDTAVQKGAQVPEVISLVASEKRLDELERDRLGRFLALVKSWLSNRTVPDSIRRHLQEELARFDRFHVLQDVEIAGADEDIEPSVKDIRNRSEIVRKRVQTIIGQLLKTAETTEATAINEHLTQISSETTKIEEAVKQLDNLEGELMLQAGQFLLKEEDELPPILPQAGESEP